ncbi:E3 ubiquitin-protein ligase RNF181-like [Herrania umbratica]|uniref:RING-type E3 ubiquitin transferase n=1 Tax=Herrania umbratica TaxID=108875 RepID=A0A6J1BNC7_9ROSI|nr:E3 ubiquitin-protein ligase RNF181-like [Herrania umbratica]
MSNEIPIAATNDSTTRNGGDFVFSLALNSLGQETTLVISVSLGFELCIEAELIESDDNSMEDSNSTLDNDIDELLVDIDSRMRPASKTVIEGLEKVKIREGLSDEKFCSVCLEEMSTEMEARRLPCSHIYHAACIVEWLKNSNKCPLCRYNMPVVDFDLNM